MQTESMRRGMWLSWEREDRHGFLVPLLAIGAGAIVFLLVVGLPPIWPQHPLHRMGVMAPTTGGTRAALALLHGDVALAWDYNPGVFFVMGGALVLAVRNAVGWLTGRWLNLCGRPGRLLIAAVIVGVAALWVNQQLSAELLTEGRDAFADRLGR